MLTTFTLLLIAALVTALLGFYYQKLALAKKTTHQAKQALLSRSAQIKRNFKSNIERFAAEGTLSKSSETAIYRLANYYFVFQPVTSETVEQYAQLVIDITNVIDGIHTTSEEQTLTASHEQIDRFAASLPAHASGYTASFYKNEMPLLMFHLSEAPQSISNGLTIEKAQDNALAS
ncbi:hypothetical protein [Vibrio sp. NH-UV-68]|uniref:hypothetical protein n=1 Tax=unclassified Vibrio TaxID=2614977 RepID=UPI0036F256EE